jgi:sterol desaturase/sphingolipid hydroxylase (fatty acid hydroxylase superfamily)
MKLSRFWDAPDHRVLAILISIMLIAMAVEFGFQRKAYDLRDTVTNLLMYAGFFLINMFWIPLVYQIYVAVYDHSIFKIGEGWYYGGSSPWSWIALFLLDDFCYYWFHRSSHQFRIFWASHSAHHSSNRFNFSVGFRQTWIPFYAFIFWVPLAFIGFDPVMILTMEMISLAVQGFLHTEVVRSYGVFDIVLNSPSHHRVHHGTQTKYLDRNFGAVLIVWDKIFGTFQSEEEQPIYGTHEKMTYNPLRVAFGPFMKLLKKEP